MATLTAKARKARAKPTYPPFPPATEPQALVRLPQILTVLPIGRTAFLDGVKAGKFPKPTKYGKSSLWKAADIRRVLTELSGG